MAKERWQLQSLDALRGFAILGVLAVHSAFWGPERLLVTPSHFLNDAIYSGQRGVQLFFLVSAFALYLSFDNRKQERHPLRNFFLRRFFRLTPMFYLATLLGLVLWREAMGPPSAILLSMAYLNNFSPAAITGGAPGSWSISTEAAFYMLLPLGFRYVRTARAGGVVFFAGELIRRASYSPHFQSPDYWRYMSLLANLSIFALGVLLYLIWRDHLRHLAGTPAARSWSAAALLLAAALFVEHPTRDPSILLYGGLLGFLLAVALLLHPWQLLVNRFTVFLGNISFSFYLLHFHVARAIQGFLIRYEQAHQVQSSESLLIGSVFLGTLIGAGALSALTWTWIEQPCIRLGKRWIEHLESRHLPGRFAGEQF